MNRGLIEIIFNFGKFFAFTPSSTKNQHPKCGQKFYESLLFTVYFVGLVTTHLYSGNMYNNLTSIQLVLAIMSAFNQFLHVFYILVVLTRFKRHNWFRLVQNLDGFQERKSMKGYYWIIGVAFTAFGLVSVFQVYTIVNDFDWDGLKFYLVQYFETFSTFFYLLFIIIILRMLLERYQQENETLFQVTKSKLLYTKQVLRILKKVKSNVFILKENVDTFNDIFGWIILCDTFDAAAKTLIYIDMIIKKDTAVQTSWLFIYNNVWILFLWVGILVTIFLCDTILKKAEDILAQAYQVEASVHDLGSFESEEVQIFIDVVLHNGPEFKAARFFSIDRSTLFSILNSLTTFLLVMIQFKEE